MHLRKLTLLKTKTIKEFFSVGLSLFIRKKIIPLYPLSKEKITTKYVSGKG